MEGSLRARFELTNYNRPCNDFWVFWSLDPVNHEYHIVRKVALSEVRSDGNCKLRQTFYIYPKNISLKKYVKIKKLTMTCVNLSPGFFQQYVWIFLFREYLI